MLEAPELTSLNQVVGGTPEFTFADDPAWRDSLEAILLTEDGTSLDDLFELFTITEGNILYIGDGRYGPFTYTWTFVAEGYEDVVISFDLSDSTPAE